MVVLGYFELPEDEVPPEEIWHNPERLEEWFAAVKQRRETGQQPIDTSAGGMVENELVQDLMGELTDV